MSFAAQKPATLIVGADSAIGKALLESLESSGEPTIGTTRRKETVSESRVYLDLSKKPLEWTYHRPVEAVVLCAGVSTLDACRLDSSGSRWINVDAIYNLAEGLSSRGVFIIFLSTNRVFDGAKPFPSTFDSVSPATEYGRQKAEAERRIGQLEGPTAIVRVTKVLGADDPLFARWRKDLRRTEKIKPYEDVGMAPVPRSSVVSTLRRILETRTSGITHVSGSEDITYATAAHWGAQALGMDPELVSPISVSASGQPNEPVPVNNTLDTHRLKHELGVNIPDVRWTIETAFIDPSRLDLPKDKIDS